MRLPNWRFLSQPLAIMKSLPAPVQTGVFAALCVLTPVLLFTAFFDWNVVNPTRIGWLMQADWGQHVLGWNAFRHVSWSSFNHESLLGAPVGNTIVSTDSNPLFAFSFKLFRDYLPAQFQYIGPWFLFCVCMHVIFAYKLIRPHAPGKWTALGGAIALSALPMLYYRERHDTLVAQWLILWALHLFINVRDDEMADSDARGLKAVASWFGRAPKMRGYAALLGVTGMIHPYILFMVAAIWGGDVLKRFMPAARSMNRKVIFDTVLRAAFVFFWAIVALYVAGSFTKGMNPDAGGYGYYSFPLDGWFNPVDPNFSSILRAWPLDAGQAFEGYQYIGFGLIVLIAAAVVLYVMTPEAREAKGFLIKLKPLTLPFAALFVIAMSNHPQFYGIDIFKVGLPELLKGPLGVLRASGRLVWPITYCMVLTALVVLFKSRPRTIAIMLPLVLVVQAYDLQGFSAVMRKATSQAASDQVFYKTPSPVWDQLVTKSSGIDFYPANVHFDDKLFYELTWRATSQTKPVNTMYAARENIIQIANQEAGQDAFKRGIVNGDHLFVFLKQCDAPAILQSRLRMLDGVWIIPPDSAKDIDLPKPVWSPIKSQVRFGWLDQGTCMLDENWSKPDTTGVWSQGPQADVVIPIRHVAFDTPHPKALDLNLRAMSHKPVTVDVLVNGIKVSQISLSHQVTQNVIHLPASVLRGEMLKVRFLVETPAGDEPAAPPVRTGRGAASSSSSANPEIDRAASYGIKLMNMTLVDPTAPPLPASAVVLKG